MLHSDPLTPHLDYLSSYKAESPDADPDAGNADNRQRHVSRKGDEVIYVSRREAGDLDGLWEILALFGLGVGLEVWATGLLWNSYCKSRKGWIVAVCSAACWVVGIVATVYVEKRDEREYRHYSVHDGKIVQQKYLTSPCLRYTVII